MYDALFQPIHIGHVLLKNRIVFAPVTTGYEEKGEITPKSLTFYENLAKGGAGMIVIGDMTPQPSMAPTPAVFDDRFLPGLTRLAQTVHTHGAKIAGQLFHQEYDMAAIMQISQTKGRSAAREQLHADMKDFCNRLSPEEIERINDKFAAAARRIEAAGFDLIQLHGDRLIGMFSSPLLNKRTDAYGGCLENRARFALDIVRRIKQTVPSMAIDYKMAIIRTDPPMGKGGPTLDEAQRMAAWLVEAGVDSFHVSQANHSAITVTIPPAGSLPYGCFVDLAQGIKQSTSVPVTAVGRIIHPEFAEGLLKAGKADLIALGRPLICDPQWPLKAQEGRPEQIRECIMCNRGCTDNLMRQKAVRCVLNAGMGEEKNPDLSPVARPRRVLVVGAGPAGMEAARVAAVKGHHVTLIEKTGQLGGQLNLATVAPCKDEMRRITHYLEREMARLNVDVRLNTNATPALIDNLTPEHVIIATGATPSTPDFPGSDGPQVVSAWDVLSGQASVGQTVVIKGGGMVGVETALFLGEQGKSVTLVTSKETIGQDESPTSMPLITERLKIYAVRILTCHRLVKSEPGSVTLQDQDDRPVRVSADNLVLAQRAVPDHTLSQSLQKDGVAFCCVGDCAQETPRTLGDAIFEGFRAAVIL